MYWSLENVPWTNLHDLNLDWIVNTMKQTVEQWIAYRIEMDGKFDDFTEEINDWKTQIDSDFADLQQYVQDYFDNLDLNESTRYVINQMIASGEFIQVLNPSIVSATEAWLASHVTPTSPVVDNTLTISGAAADAKVTGDNITNLTNNLNNYSKQDVFEQPFDILKMCKPETTTMAGVTYTVNLDGTISITGTATETSFLTYWFSWTNMPFGLYPGQEMLLKHSSENVHVRIYENYDENNFTEICNATTDTTFNISSTASGITIRLWIASGTQVNETVNPKLYYYNLYNEHEHLIKTRPEVYDSVASDRAVNMLPIFTNVVDSLTAGIKWSVMEDGSYKAVGTSTSVSFFNLFFSWTDFPTGIYAGQELYLDYSSTNVYFYVYANFGINNFREILRTTGDARFTIPSDATGITFRLWCTNGVTVNEIVTPKLYDAKKYFKDDEQETYDFTSILNRTTATNNGITYTNIGVGEYQINGTATATSFYNLFFDYESLPGDIQAGTKIYIEYSSENVFLYGYYNVHTAYTEACKTKESVILNIPSNATGITLRLWCPSGTVVNETVKIRLLTKNYDAVELKMLVFGNSYSYSTLYYLPMILRAINPNIFLTLGILYNSGESIEGHISKWGTAYTQYSKFVGNRWNVLTGYAGADALADEEWDVVCLQQAIGSNGHYLGVSNVPDLISLIDAEMDHPFTYLWNMDQSWGANDPRWNNSSVTVPGDTGEEKSQNQMTEKYNAAQQLMNTTKILDVLPTGTAVQNARTTSLKTYGVQGYMVLDDAGHLQAGIGTLVAGYAAAYKILDFIAGRCKTCCIPFSPTDPVLTLYNITLYRPSVGITDNNLLTAEKCATLAYKIPYATTNC